MNLRPLLLILALVPGCADMGHQGDDQVSVRPVANVPAPPLVNNYVNDHQRLVTIYYADGQLQPVAAGDVVALRPGVDYVVQVSRPHGRFRAGDLQ
jgi:hypothetical protein